MVFLNSRSDGNRDLKNALKYDRPEIASETIINALRNRDLVLKAEFRENLGGENSLVKEN